MHIAAAGIVHMHGGGQGTYVGSTATFLLQLKFKFTGT